MNPNNLTPSPEQPTPKLDRAKSRQLGRILTEVELWDDGISAGFFDKPTETEYGNAEFEENLDPETVARRETIATLERPLEDEFESADADLVDSPFIDNDYNRALDGDIEAKERVEALREWVLDALYAQEETLARQRERMRISEERKARTAELAKKIYQKVKFGLIAAAAAVAFFVMPTQLADEGADGQIQTVPYRAMAAEGIDTSSDTFMIPDVTESISQLASEETEPAFEEVTEEAPTEVSPAFEEVTEEAPTEVSPAFEEVTEEAPTEVSPAFEETVEEIPAEPEVQHVEDDNAWDGPVINAVNGTVEGPSGKETYYNLPMQGVIDIMRSIGNNDEYWVRDDGCKMLGDYIMVAADLDIHPRGSLVPTSRGMGIVCDTGEFIYSNPQQLDIATSW